MAVSASFADIDPKSHDKYNCNQDCDNDRSASAVGLTDVEEAHAAKVDPHVGSFTPSSILLCFLGGSGAREGCCRSV